MDKIMKQEIFRDIDGFEGKYQVSNYGRIMGLEYTYNRGRQTVQGIRKTHVIKPYPNTKAYEYFVASFKEDGKHSKSKTMSVHRLVARAFPEICGEWFEGCVVHHKDRNPLNNRADNLIIMSRSEHEQFHRDNRIEPKKREAQAWYKYDLDWNFLCYYENSTDAAASVLSERHCFTRSLKRSNNNYFKGYHWLKA